MPLIDAKKRLSDRINLGNDLLKKSLTNIDQLNEALRESNRWHRGNLYIIEQMFTNKIMTYEYDPPFGVIPRPSPDFEENRIRYQG